MSKTLTVLMAQINPTVGAIRANTDLICDIIASHQAHHDIIVFPELAVTGYPPEDLLFRPAFLSQVDDAMTRIANTVQDCFVLVGHPAREEDGLYNRATVFHQGKAITHHDKKALPNQGVFDEVRYFEVGTTKPTHLDIQGYRVGVCICEDIWQDGAVQALAAQKADMMLVLNASPFEQHKQALRISLAKKHTTHGMAIVYVNLVGGQDELLFDGQSFAMDKAGVIQAQAPAFQTDLATFTYRDGHINGMMTPPLSETALLYKALTCGTHDYIHKNGFPGILLGLSGGIDSALTLAIAVDALGHSRVHSVMMPSRYTQKMSIHDAQLQADTLGVKHTLLPIDSTFDIALQTLTPAFEGRQPDITEENLQARIRGMFLMALSNKTGSLVLCTSNKSEAAVGYSTLYGDMVGGLSILKDVLKTEVYALARYRNSVSPVIPDNVITRAPSAELRFDQKDSDSLPDYALLDALITRHLVYHDDSDDLVAAGFPEADVRRVLHLIQRQEYKRRQAPPGLKVSPRAFGRDWRYPITSGFSPLQIHDKPLI